MRLLLLILWLAVSAEAVEQRNDTRMRQQFVIGLSPYLEKTVKDDVYRGMVRLIVDELPLDSTLSVFDAFQLRSITEITVPDRRVFTSQKTRANQFAGAIQSIKQFLAQEHPKPANPRLRFGSAIRLPQFCEFLSERGSATNGPLSLLLLGSPLYQDDKEPAFSMVDGYYPSDGHLQAPREKSVFGLGGEAKRSRPLFVSWVYFGDPWLNDLHKEKVTRFWTLFLERRAGQLVSFSGDFPTGLRAFHQGPGALPTPVRLWSVDPEQTKIEMLRSTRRVELADWISRDNLNQTSQPPPGTTVGPMKIGIRWRDRIDLDLYATPGPGAETLFFEHPRSSDGYYYRDHRSSPGREYEFIEFEKPVDVRKVEAFVNFYQGACPGGARGEVRVEFDGRIYSAPFVVSASDGNLGRSGLDQQEYWTRIPVPEILKLNAGSADAAAVLESRPRAVARER